MPAVLPIAKAKKGTVAKKPGNRGTRATPTPMQARAIALFQENIVTNGTKTVEAILLEAGYDPDSAKQQTNIMAGIKPHLEPIVQEMEELRVEAMARMRKTIKGASYGEVTRAVHTLTHNIRLLSGKSTANVAMITREQRERIDELIEA